MKKAFTMLELIIVVVVIGIIAAAMIPRLQGSQLKKDVVVLVSKIRYTQHLALVDKKFDPSQQNWFRNRWQIVFGTHSYTIVSNNNTTYAIDPITHQPINNIELKGVKTITLSGGCAGSDRITFDAMGRPLIKDISSMTTPYVASGNNGELLPSQCSITLSDGSISRTITIEPETGYVSY